jgi:hypothetical protein
MNLNRTVVLALVVGVGAPLAIACDDKDKTPVAPADTSPAPNPSADQQKKEQEAKEKAEKEKAEKEAKERADKEKAENEEFSAAFIVGLKFFEPIAGAIALPEAPVDVVEVPGAPPGNHFVWIPGHWWYDYPAREYVWQQGMWVDKVGYPPNAPEAELVEVVSLPPPGDGWFWAPGFWRWDGNKFDWGYGHWLRHRDGWEWVHPFYENIDGHWQSRGWGWEKAGPGWAKAHEGWDHHGDIWAHKGYFNDREKFIKEHQPEFREKVKAVKPRPNEPQRPPEKHRPPVDKHEAKKEHK